jgi:hypothetical protein
LKYNFPPQQRRMPTNVSLLKNGTTNRKRESTRKGVARGGS